MEKKKMIIKDRFDNIRCVELTDDQKALLDWLDKMGLLDESTSYRLLSDIETSITTK